MKGTERRRGRRGEADEEEKGTERNRGRSEEEDCEDNAVQRGEEEGGKGKDRMLRERKDGRMRGRRGVIRGI